MTDRPTDLKPGTLVASRYEIVRRLGQGGMGTVYEALDHVLDETVALKLLRSDLATDADLVRRFRQEIKLARKARHKNVCAVHEFGEDSMGRFISMEYIEGADLRYLVRAAGGLPWPEAYAIAIQIADGLQAIHDAGIIHRDLKTPNIMKDAKGVVRLMDFGIAKLGGSDASIATVAGQVLGTPEYMSPEQIRGEDIDARIDIYALGVVVFEIFSGRVPFKGETPLSTIYKHLQDPPPFAEVSRIPPSLVPVLRKALAKNRDDRFTTAAEMGAELRRAQGAAATEATVATTRPHIPAPAKPATTRCPMCSEPIKAGARKCPHCKEYLDPALKAERQRGGEVPSPRAIEQAELDGQASQALIGTIIVMTIASCLGIFGGPWAILKARKFTERYQALALEPPRNVGRLRFAGFAWLAIGLVMVVWIFFAGNTGSSLPATPPPAPPPVAATAKPTPLTENQRLELSCQAGKAADCYTVASLHNSGEGASRDSARAVLFFDKGCALGHALACANLGFLVENGIGAEIDRARAAAAYKKACSLGEACEQARRFE